MLKIAKYKKEPIFATSYKQSKEKYKQQTRKIVGQLKNQLWITLVHKQSDAKQ